MKRKTVLSWFLTFAFLLSSIACLNANVFMAAAASEPGSPENFGFIAETIDLSNNQFKLSGYFYNNNQIYEISQMQSFSITVYDKNRKQIVVMSIPDGDNLQNIVLPANSTLSYAFTLSNFTLDRTKFDLSNFTASVNCRFSYREITPTRSIPAPAPTQPIYSPQVPIQAPSKVTCYTCSGTGWMTCKACGGDGIILTKTRHSIDLGSGSTSWTEDVRCSCGTGKVRCSTCGGTGTR